LEKRFISFTIYKEKNMLLKREMSVVNPKKLFKSGILTFLISSTSFNRLLTANPIPHQSLEAIRNNNTVLNDLKPFLSHCDSLDVFNQKNHELDPCQKARFIFESLRLEQKLRGASIPSLDLTKAEEIRSNVPETVAYDQLSYGDFFASYEMERKSLMIKGTSEILKIKNAARKLTTCAIEYYSSKANAKPLNSFFSLDECRGFDPNANLNVPKYIMNDYLQRVNFTKAEGSMNSILKSSFQVALIKYSSHLSLSDGTCPSLLHSFYIIISQGSNGPVLKTKIFTPESLSKLEPHIALKEKPFPSYDIVYDRDVWDEDIPHIDGSSDIILNHGDAIFVPSGSSASFSNKNIIASSEEDILLMRFCFLDASNLNDVKSRLQLGQIIDDGQRKLLYELSKSSFDVRMQRDVPRLSNWTSEYKIWPRNLSGNDDSTSSLSHRKLKRSRRKRAKYFNWQIDRSWDYKILGLTLPTLPPPDLIDKGRRNVTLTWTCPFQKREDDTKQVIYLVAWEEYNLDGNLQSNSSVTFNELSVPRDDFNINYIPNEEQYLESDGQPIKVLKAQIKNLKAASEYMFRVALVYGEGQSRCSSLFSAFSRRIRTEPSTKPFPLSSPPELLEPHLWDDTLGNGMDNSRRFIPAYGSEASTLILQFHSPYDDGGHDITQYDVMSIGVNPRNKKYLNKWSTLTHGIEEVKNEKKAGGKIYLAIHNLIPGQYYEFKVAARNKLGISEWSHISNKVSTKLPEKYIRTENVHRSLYSSNTHGFIPPNGYRIHGLGAHKISSPIHYASKAPILTLNDMDQTVLIAGMAGKTNVWSSFWSPRRFIVSAEACGALLGKNGEIENEDNLKHRIAVMDRKKNKYSFARQAWKAQSAGALAIIFLDHEDCVDFDQYCVFGSNKHNGDYWGELDLPNAWEYVQIPVVLARENDLILEGIKEKIYWFDTK